MCAAIASCGLFSVFASEGEAQVPGVVGFFEKTGTTAVSLFSRLINKLEKTDETAIPKAQVMGNSWEDVSGDFRIENPEVSLSAETWVMNELTFESSVSYEDPFNDADIDLILIGNGRKYTVPGFWDGGNIWKARFVCPLEGYWYFTTVCSDESNSGLHGHTGTVFCSEYKGKYEIYKRGFVTTSLGEKYFTYNDSTPFLYLGDTHWSLGDETVDMVETICDKREEQGFTVIQSEPIGAAFDFADGIRENDIPGLKVYDEKFAVIASHGLVHANAEFFFPYSMQLLIEQNGGYSDREIASGKYEVSDDVKTYLEKISRYWVARYSAYPVIWTLGQEVDKDFYSNDKDHPQWNYINNPYKLVAEYISKYDCWDHPLTAHQENSGVTSTLGNKKGEGTIYRKNAVPSVFRDVKAHNFYAAQWTPSKRSQSDFSVEKDYWYNSQGKPSINYEGQYCYLWTKNYGARMQGWCAYLNGMYGCAWGGQDTWSYTNIYNENEDSDDGVDKITSEEKKNATWQDSLEYISTYQCGYMLKFLSRFAWYNLIPRFDNKSYFAPCNKVYYCMASNPDNSEGMIYFYSFTDKTIAERVNTKGYGGVLTGTLGNLEANTEYKYIWFNPVTGEASDEMTFVSSCFGTYYIGERTFGGRNVENDMVFYYAK